MEKKTALLNKSTHKPGAGGTTFRATLPTKWIRAMGMSEDIRSVEMVYENKTITIKKAGD